MSEGQLNNANYTGRPSMCQNCGALVGADETSCSLCGAQKTSNIAPQAQAQPRVQDREARRFARAILSRPYIFTIIFLAANIFVFMLMSTSGGSENPDTLIAYGAKLNLLIDAGEWWRFVTPIFIHIGPLHLLVNMYGLWMIGPYVERLYGSAKFVVLWVLTGIAGVVASYFSLRPSMQGGALSRFLFRAVDGPAAGASGALFGLIGVLFVFGIKFRRELPEGFKRAFGTGLLPIILINLVIGYVGRAFIDNAAHLGGLFAGAIFALAIGYKRPGERTGVAVFWHILQIAALALVVLSFTMVVLRYGRPVPSLSNITPPSLTGGEPAIKLYLDALSAGEAAFVKAFDAGDAGEVDPAVEQLERTPRLDDKANAQREELKALLGRAKELAGAAKPADRQGARARNKQRETLRSEFEAWQKRQVEWIKTEGKGYGVTLVKPDSGEPTPAKDK